MEFIVKGFDELTNCELYEILKARAKVFMFEQKIWYLDMDNVDYDALHLFLWENGEVKAYLRAFYGEDESAIRIGRVLSVVHNQGLGTSLMKKAIEHFKAQGIKEIRLNSQMTAVNFYKRLGFSTVGEEFIEAGIPHIKMVKVL